MTIHLMDGIAVIRRELETDQLGRAPRKLFNEQLSLPAGDVAVWCWDGPGAKKHRQAIYPLYKANREPQPSAIWKTIQMMQEVFKHTPALQITIPTFEADDLIAHFSRTSSPSPVLIHSVDKDLSALFTLPGVRGTFEPPKGIDPRWVPLFKLCVGDPSDNIKGVPGFGRGTWDKVAALGLLQDLYNFAVLFQAATDLLFDVLPKKVKTWFEEDESLSTLNAMERVISFRDVPSDRIKFITGKRDFAAGDAILKEFLL